MNNQLLITKNKSKMGVSNQKNTSTETAPDFWHTWLAEERLARLLTIINFITLLTGWLLEGEETIGTSAWVFYAIAYLSGGYFGVQAGWASLREWKIDVDLLMILAAVGAALVGAPFEGALLLFLFSLSNVLQDYALDRTRNAIRALMDLRPHQAQVRRGAEILTLGIDDIRLDDVLLIRPGEQIALDGIIIEGESAIDQSSLTGESIPVHKRVGDEVLAGTINQKGALEVRVTKAAEDSTIARLIKLVEEAREEKANTEQFIDKAEQYYAVGVILMTIAAIIIPLLFIDEPFGTSFYRAMTLMVAASPCALVISTPATVLSAIGNGARHGVLFKGGAYVEQAADLKVVAFDKTGTLTVGKPAVVRIATADAFDEEEVLALAAAVEAKSEHPLAQAIAQKAAERNLKIPEVKGFQSETGQGVYAQINEETVYVGNLRYMEQLAVDAQPLLETIQEMQDNGQTAVVIARQSGSQMELLGTIGIADELRDNAAEVVRQLKKEGIKKVVMLTGDNERVAKAIAHKAGVDEFYANLMPEDKLTILKKLEKEVGPVAMVGDGVNDAPALATATIGMAMGAAGTDVALETADVVLMADNLSHVPYMIGLSHQTKRVLIQNLVFATGMIAILIAAVLGFSLPLPLSVVGHEGSTVLVSLNGLRMLGYRG